MGMRAGSLTHRLVWLILPLALACGSGDVGRKEAKIAPGAGVAPLTTPERVILFLGTSLTAGYGLPAGEGFPARIQEKIDEAELTYRVVNAGVSGDTSAGALRRLDWLLRQPISVLVVELGANDMLRGQRISAMRANLQAIVDRVAESQPSAKLVVAGMRAAPNLGTDYASEFEASFRELAERNRGALIPFLLEGVAGRPELNQSDGIHPTAEGQRIVASNVWKVLEPLLMSSTDSG
ncbi:MAG: arylesterase [Myxococcales bacterium]|nr:arylesterase [Myxococcales bacterium]